jgi:hypothetical protein
VTVEIGPDLFLVRIDFFFDGHVFELARFEHIPALLTFDILGVFVARDNLHPGMLALIGIHFLGGRGRRLTRRHKRADSLSVAWVSIFPNFPPIVRRLF